MAVKILEFESPYCARPGQFETTDELGETLLVDYRDYVVPLDPGDYDLSYDPRDPHFSILTVTTAGGAILHFASTEIPDTELATAANGHRIEPTSILPPLYVDEDHPIIVCWERHEPTGATLVHKVVAYRDF